MAEEEEIEEPTTISYPLALTRIALGVSLGAIVISILFSIWVLVNDRGGPIIGTFLFQLLAFASIGVVAINAWFKRVELV